MPAGSSASRTGNISTSSRVTARCASSTCRSPGHEQECATNFDPLVNKYSPETACIPFNEAKRRPYSTEVAGLRFPTIPIDVAAADLSGPEVEDTVNGGYAWVLTANGAIYLVNIDPESRRIRAVVHDMQETLFVPDVRPPDIAGQRSSSTTTAIRRDPGWCSNRRRIPTGRAIAT